MRPGIAGAPAGRVATPLPPEPGVRTLTIRHLYPTSRTCRTMLRKASGRPRATTAYRRRRTVPDFGGTAGETRAGESVGACAKWAVLKSVRPAMLCGDVLPAITGIRLQAGPEDRGTFRGRGDRTVAGYSELSESELADQHAVVRDGDTGGLRGPDTVLQLAARSRAAAALHDERTAGESVRP